MTISDPKFPTPESLADCVQLLTFAGVEAIKPAMEWLEAHPEAIGGKLRTIKGAHQLLDRAGYMLEDALGVPDGTFGAGGGGPKPW